MTSDEMSTFRGEGLPRQSRELLERAVAEESSTWYPSFERRGGAGYRYVSRGWELNIFGGRARWSENGMRIEAILDFDGNRRPFVSSFKVTSTTAPTPVAKLLGPQGLARIERRAIAEQAFFGAPGPGRRKPLLQVKPSEASWSRYVRAALAPANTTVEEMRSNSIDYRRVAVLYLEALERGVKPSAYIASHYDASTPPSAAAIRKWIDRATQNRWLTAPSGLGRTATRSRGPRFDEDE